MNRKNFLKTVGLAGFGLAIPTSKAFSQKRSLLGNPVCELIPSETAGPFPLDLSDNSFYLRQDVREDRTGVQLNLKIKVIGHDNCAPMPNVRVNIWHCDKDGNYSGYNSETGLTYLRGYQMADANGEIEFITIVPGWYNGRVCHIHFQVYVSASYAAISQLTFDHNTLNGIFSDNSTIYTKGPDPLTPATDNIFSDGYALQVASLSPNLQTGGYDSYLEVTVNGSGTVGVSNVEKETAKQLSLGQNFPNPFENATRISFSLQYSSQVKLELWNLAGQKVAVLEKGKLSSGRHTIELDLESMGLPNGNYLYQLEVVNSNGVFKDCKMMTHAR
ncbi:MAG: T9SS type A sorting domain-containing protein [Lewinellaceae bacterium]|nr:T9SS type A sorting domain-containing protein [Lewinellaceae bacterium]